VVKPGDVAVDIGTGTGILAIAAAKAGASTVYAIEATRIADAAEAVARANGVADRVHLVRGWSTHVDLPQRADVLVTEIIGHEPFSEDALLLNWDARRRFLKDDARFIPSALRLYAYPARASPSLRARTRFTREATSAWHARYGIDFSCLLDLHRPGYTETPSVEAATWEALAEPALLGEVSFATCGTTLELRGGGTIDRAGVVDALVVSFELVLAPGVILSTAPKATDATNAWTTPVWLVDDTPVAAGQAWTAVYRHGKPRGDMDFKILEP
jgi:hypothetical protein